MIQSDSERRNHTPQAIIPDMVFRLASQGTFLDFEPGENIEPLVPPGEFLRSGLWAWCRHPNYLGGILFWWGLLAFSLAAGVFSWWTAVGAIAITVMFRVVSLPMIERRMIERRPAYAEHARQTSALLPRPPATG